MSVVGKQPVIIAAGGTGGHVFPALAVARELESRDVPVVWVGTQRGIESSIVPESGIPLRLVTVTALRGRGVIAKIVSGCNLIAALGSSVKIIRHERPRAVLGMGGYVSGPVCMAARLCGKHMVVHEQNAVAGFTNNILKRFATRVMEAMSGTFSSAVDAVHTGNPVREDILLLAPPEIRLSNHQGKPRILIVGGSQGARALNEIIPAAISKLTTAVTVRHQCGERWQQVTESLYDDCPHNAQVQPFIKDMAEAYGWADLIICRSGAMTIAELSAVGLAAILIPYPAAVDDHQTANGQYLVEAGAAVLVQETVLNAAVLAEKISSLIEDKNLLVTMAKNGRAASRRDATQLVVDEILGVAA